MANDKFLRVYRWFEELVCIKEVVEGNTLEGNVRSSAVWIAVREDS